MHFKWNVWFGNGCLRNNALVLNFASHLVKADQKYRRLNLDLVSGCTNKTAVLSGEKSVVSMSKESNISRVKRKERAGGLF
jgi:hypothetical protein